MFPLQPSDRFSRNLSSAPSPDFSQSFPLARQTTSRIPFAFPNNRGPEVAIIGRPSMPFTPSTSDLSPLEALAEHTGAPPSAPRAAAAGPQVPPDAPIRPADPHDWPEARIAAQATATRILAGVQAACGSSEGTVVAGDPADFAAARSTADQLVASGFHAATAVIATPMGDIPAIFVGPADEIARVRQELVFGDHAEARPFSFRTDSKYNAPVDVRPFSSNPLPAPGDVGRAVRFMAGRLLGKVEPGSIDVPALNASKILSGTGGDLPTVDRHQRRPETPVLNALNALLKSPLVKPILEREGIEVEIPELLIRLSQTTPRQQNKQAWEVDSFLDILGIGTHRMAIFAAQGDWKGVSDAGRFIQDGLNYLSDAVLRPGRSTFTEEAQSSAFTKLQEGLELLGVPLITQSTFFELSLSRNLASENGTGLVAYDRDRDNYVPRVELNPATGGFVLMRDAVVKSFWQGQVAFSAPPEHANPLVGRFSHAAIDGAATAIGAALTPAFGPAALPAAQVAGAIAKPLADTFLSGGIYGLAEVRVIDYGANKGYLRLPAGTELSERQLALVMEAITEPAAFSEAGRNPDDLRLLARTFDTMAIHPAFDGRNRGDNLLGLVQQNRAAEGPHTLRVDADVKAEVIWNPLAHRSVTVPGTGISVPVTWVDGANPFAILQSISLGLVAKINTFPIPTECTRAIAMGAQGKVLEQAVSDRIKDRRPDNVTIIEVASEQPGGRAGTVALPNSVALALTGSAPLWDKKSEAAVLAFLNRVDDGTDPAVSRAAAQAYFAFARQPATGIIWSQQRDALTAVVLAEARRTE